MAILPLSLPVTRYSPSLVRAAHSSLNSDYFISHSSAFSRLLVLALHLAQLPSRRGVSDDVSVSVNGSQQTLSAHQQIRHGADAFQTTQQIATRRVQENRAV